MSIEARRLTKRYGDKTAVDDLTFTVRPGMVTGFLGVNGAGKSTTMRLILGLDSPTNADFHAADSTLGQANSKWSRRLPHQGTVVSVGRLAWRRTGE
jgi:ABC-type multidrug transport system ATPase subunit